MDRGFNPGDRVRLKTHILMPNIDRGEVGVVSSIEADIYPVNVNFDNYAHLDPVPCWEHELLLISSTFKDILGTCPDLVGSVPLAVVGATSADLVAL